jgi:hypothetical protein
MAIKISFDMPYSLSVDGEFLISTNGEKFNVTLSTQPEKNPKFPGAEKVENVAIVHDETNILSHTKVVARYDPSDPSTLADPARFSTQMVNIALSITNALVTAARRAYGEYFLEYIYGAERLGPIKFSVSGIEGVKSYSGVRDPLMGGITSRTPPRSGLETAGFGRILANGAAITVAEELYFDARRYLLRGNNRMALANLVISFEVGLADNLSRIAASRNDSALEAQIEKGTLGGLEQTLAKQTLGHSFENRTYWGSRFCDAYGWLRGARNSVLHKAQMLVTVANVTRDFRERNELEGLFAERDWLANKIDTATAQVIAGKPAKP